MSDKLTAEELQEFNSQLQKSIPAEVLSDSTKKQYMQMLCGSYCANLMKESELIEYAEDLEDPIIRQTVIECIKKMKIKRDQKKEAELKVAKEGEVQKNRKAQKRAPEKPADEKNKIFDRMQEGDAGPKKKVKTDKHQSTDQAGLKQPSSEVDPDVKEEQGTERKAGLKQHLETLGKQKCRFYPFCRNPESCGFFHPTDKCQYFPNCRFGENCLYIHETCKFKEQCKKMNCPYAHPYKKNKNDFAAMFEMMMKSNNPLKTKKPRPQKREPNKEEDKA